MKVGIDVTATTTGQTGVARYARELVAAIGDAGVVPSLFALGRGHHEPPANTRRLRVPLRIVHVSWALLHAPLAEWLAAGVDLVHALDLVPPPTRRPVVMTVHDLAALELPDQHHPRHVHEQRQQLRAAQSAAGVCTVSRVTADALARHGVRPDRITVTPLGLTRLPDPVDPAVQPPFFLAVGELTARKGLDTLIDAFLAADLPEQWRLVLAGPPGPDAGAVLARVGPRVLALGAVTDAVLAGLYSTASALCFPSSAEGFGLPVLEAMSFGLRVIASDLPVVHEVAQDVPTYVTPGDIQEWRRALCAATDEPDSPSRKTSGRRRAAEFTWARTARLTADAYRRVLQCE